jgi:hypothetical protein
VEGQRALALLVAGFELHVFQDAEAVVAAAGLAFGELVVDALTNDVFVVVLVILELAVVVLLRLVVLDGFIDLDALLDPVLVLELDILDVPVFDVFIV